MALRSLVLLLLVSAVLGACNSNRQPGADLPVREGPPENREANPNAETASRRGSQEDIPFVENDADICTFGRRRPPVVMSYRAPDGLDLSGEIPPQNYPDFPDSIPTAIARPVSDSYRIVVDHDCYDAERRVYYSCPQAREVSIADIRGIARADSLETAARLAVQACRQRTYGKVAEELQIRQESYDLHCRVVERRFCDRPAAPDPPPARQESDATTN